MKTMIAIPCMDTVNTVFLKSALLLERVGDTRVGITYSSLVYDARNILAKQALDGGFDRVLWLDSDMDFQPDLMKRLAADMDEGMEYVSGLYFTRKAPIKPTAYSAVGYEQGTDIPVAVSMEDYPEDAVFEVKATGLGACMMTTDLIKRVADNFGLPFSPILGFGEDLSFCMRATNLGAKLYCDSRVKLGHVAHWMVTEDTFKEGRMTAIGGAVK